MQAVWTTQLPLAFNPIGEHQTFLLEPNTVYTVFFPFHRHADTPQRVRVQFTNRVWVRLDGGTPAINSGFELPKDEIQDWYIQIGDGLVKLMTPHNKVYLQAQWLGFPMNCEAET